MTSRKWFSQTAEPVAALGSAHLADAAHAFNLYSLDVHLELDFIPIKRQSIRMEEAKVWFSLSLAWGTFSDKFPTVAGTGCLRTISILPAIATLSRPVIHMPRTCGMQQVGAF